MLSRRLTNYFLLLLVLISFAKSGHANSISPLNISEPIELDGIHNEKVWQEAEAANRFQMNYPNDSLMAASDTEVKILFDNENLYIGAVCHNTKKGEQVIQSLKRDFEYLENESFLILLDPYNNANIGMTFGVNPKGVQLDGIIPRGGNKGISTNWDAQWAVEVHEDVEGKFWSIEMAIPWKVLDFNNKTLTWNINFVRNDMKNNQVSTWSPVPRSFDVATLAKAGKATWCHLPEQCTSKVTFVPYTAVRNNIDYTDNKKIDSNLSIGGDLKVALSSSLNLDVTVNPDFSQVEVDQQVIDLNRFELFFPEKRLLFLENSDLLSGLGNSRTRPYFSRRIGSAGRNPVPILFGARLSGKLKNDWNIGVMTVQTKSEEDIADRGQNYTIAAIQKPVLNGSNITAFVANRQASSEFNIFNDYNRLAGVEFDYRSGDSKWVGKTFLHYSISDKFKKGDLVYSGKMRYRTRKATLFFGVDGVGENYQADMGYVPHLFHNYNDTTYRIPYVQYRSNGYYRFFIKNNKVIDYISPQFNFNLFMDKTGFSYQEHSVDLSLVLKFMNASELTFATSQYSPKLFFPFHLDGLNRAFDVGNYSNSKFSLEFDSGKLKRLYWKSFVGFGGEYMGDRFDFMAEVNYRIKHFFTGGLSFSQQNLINFPQDYGSAYFTLVGSKFEVSFSKNLFFTTFLQYNTQTNNFNINSRFNWRFRPMSDLYIVYTENYRADNVGIKDRALVMKVNYWFNL